MVLPYSVTVSVRRIGPIVVVRLGGAPLLLEMATVPLNFLKVSDGYFSVSFSSRGLPFLSGLTTRPLFTR